MWEKGVCMCVLVRREEGKYCCVVKRRSGTQVNEEETQPILDYSVQQNSRCNSAVAPDYYKI